MLVFVGRQDNRYQVGSQNLSTEYPIHFLWATPRSTSTAFEWMMRQRGDLACFHEPFGVAWYHGPEARAPREAPEHMRKPEATFDSIWKKILAAAEKRPVFVKDMPHHTSHFWDDAFVNRISHSFLIRDPAKVLASLHRSYEKAGMSQGLESHEISFDAQQTLFQRLQQETGTTPVVIDSDDLLERPSEMVAAYCHGIGIPFIEEALTWEPGARSEVLWYDSNDDVWHGSLRDSSGLEAQPRKSVAVKDLPAYLQAQYPEFLACYQTLYPHRITLDSAVGQ